MKESDGRKESRGRKEDSIKRKTDLTKIKAKFVEKVNGDRDRDEIC